MIARASAWIDNYCELPHGLYASVNSEVYPSKISGDGYLRIRPRNIPIIQLQSLQWRVYPTAAWTVVDVTNVQVYDRYFETLMWFPFFNGPALSIGNAYAYPITAPYTPYLTPIETAKVSDMQITAQYSYINGYANTALSANATLGANSITLDDVTGITTGTTMTMFDGGSTEKITVSAPPSGNTVTLAKPLMFAHTLGIAVSAIPADVKQATILVVNYFLKERGVNSITMEGVQNPLMQKYDDVRDLEIAKDMLRRYRRVV